MASFRLLAGKQFLLHVGDDLHLVDAGVTLLTEPVPVRALWLRQTMARWIGLSVSLPSFVFRMQPRLHLSASWVKQLKKRPRSFFAGGSRQIVMSHTPLRDNVSERFTTRLVQRDSGAQDALRETMLELIGDAGSPALADPAAWGSLVLVGRP